MQILEDNMKDISLEKQDNMKAASNFIYFIKRKLVTTYIKNYQEPSAENDENKINKGSEKIDESKLKEELPLGEGVLRVNLGIPLVILCTKSDTLDANEKGFLSEQSFDVFVKTIRTLGLLCKKNFLKLTCYFLDGATTIFVSEKSQINVELFYHYLMHRLYKFPLKYKAILDEKSRNFIPSGLDSLTLIRYFNFPNIFIVNPLKMQDQLLMKIFSKCLRKQR